MTKKELRTSLRNKANELGIKIRLNSLQPTVRTFFQQRSPIWGCYIVDKNSTKQRALCVSEVTGNFTIVECDYILSYGMNTVIKEV